MTSLDVLVNVSNLAFSAALAFCFGKCWIAIQHIVCEYRVINLKHKALDHSNLPPAPPKNESKDV